MQQLRKFDRLSSNKWDPRMLGRVLKIAKTFGKVSASQVKPAQLVYDIPLKPNGFPDFSNYVIKGKGKRVFIRLTESRRQDDKAANLATFRVKKPTGYTWHHHEIIGLMELVRTDVHRSFGHEGGALYYTITNNLNEYKK